MKKLILTATFMIAGFNGTSALADRAGGGGNVRSSSPQEVMTAISKAESTATAIVNYAIQLYMAPEAIVPILDPKAREMLPKIQKARNTIAFTIDPKKNGACVYKGLNRDSSLTKLVGPFTKFCISVERLTRFPESSLVNEITGLLVHEAAHAAGYEDEKDCEYIQNYILEKYLYFDCHIRFDGVDEHLKSVNSRYYLTAVSIDFPRQPLPETHVRNYFSNKDDRSDASVIDSSISINSFNLAQVMKGKWSGHSGGYIEFPTVESDATVKNQHVEFGPFQSEPNQDFQHPKVAGPGPNINGNVLNIKNFTIFGCER